MGVSVGKKQYTDMAKYQPKSLKNDSKDNIEVTTLEILERTETRSKLTPIITLGCTIFLLGSAWIGAEKGNFEELKTVWGIVGPLLGILTGYYYRSDHGKRNH